MSLNNIGCLFLLLGMADPPTLTVRAVNTQSHDLASKSHGESKNLKIARQWELHDFKKSVFKMVNCINLFWGDLGPIPASFP